MNKLFFHIIITGLVCNNNIFCYFFLSIFGYMNKKYVLCILFGKRL